MKEMPIYDCHKKVRALQIEEVKALIGHPQFSPEGSLLLIFVDKGYEPVKVFPDWAKKHRPEPGGYYVQYEDGYTSFSPQLAFESGYTIEKPVIDVQGFSISQTA